MAKLKPPLPPPGTTVTWEFSYLTGDGDPAMGSGVASGNERHFDSTVTSEGTVEVRVEITVGTTPPVIDDRNVEVVKPEAVAVSFENDIDLRHWEFDDTGYDIMDPVWEKPLGGAVTKNEPAAYVRSRSGTDSQAEAELEIEASSPLMQTKFIKVRGRGDENFHEKQVSVKNWTFSSGELLLKSSPLFSSLNIYDKMGIDWEYVVKKQDGSFPPWSEGISLGSSEHRVFTTLDMPVTGPVPTPVFDLAVAKAAKCYAKGLTDAGAIAERVTLGIDADLCYDPAEVVALGLPLNAYIGGSCLCFNNAQLLEQILKNVGIAAEMRLFYGACSAGGFREQYLNSAGGGGSAQFRVGRHDLSWDNPDFSYHAQTMVSGRYYDPSFGLFERADIIHVCESSDACGPGSPISHREHLTLSFSPPSSCPWVDGLHVPDFSVPGCTTPPPPCS